MRRSHKGPNRNFVGLDEVRKWLQRAVYIYIYVYGLAGWAGGARKVSTPEWRTGDSFAHDVRDL